MSRIGAALGKQKAAKRVAASQRGREWYNRFNAARSVACEQVKVAYRPVDCPQDDDTLIALGFPLPESCKSEENRHREPISEERERYLVNTAKVSYEIMPTYGV